MSGILGVDQQATQTIFMNTVIMFYGFVFGIQTTVSSQVGQQIGRQDVDKALKYLNVCKWIARIQILSTAAFFYLIN